jgi:hypothetical protein
MKLSLAKIAISPAKKPNEARTNSRTTSTPMPTTPQTAPLEGSASFASPNKLRRASTILRPKSRGEGMRTPTTETTPPVPQLNPTMIQQKRSTTMGRMVARGADEREPTLILPPCPDNGLDPNASAKARALRRRKSLMEFMDSL